MQTCNLGFIVTLRIPNICKKSVIPRFPPLFKAKPETVRDKIFQTRLEDDMKIWTEAKNRSNIPLLIWWEQIVKPGVKKLLRDRTKELTKKAYGELNMLLLQQTFLVKEIQKIRYVIGSERVQGRKLLCELKEVQTRIRNWYRLDCEKVKYQAKVDEINSN